MGVSNQMWLLLERNITAIPVISIQIMLYFVIIQNYAIIYPTFFKKYLCTFMFWKVQQNGYLQEEFLDSIVQKGSELVRYSPEMVRAEISKWCVFSMQHAV